MVGEYIPGGSGTIGTNDQNNNNGYFIYETNDGGNTFLYGKENKDIVGNGYGPQDIKEVFNFENGSTKIIFTSKGKYAIKSPSISAGYGQWRMGHTAGTSLSFGYDTKPVAYFPSKDGKKGK